MIRRKTSAIVESGILAAIAVIFTPHRQLYSRSRCYRKRLVAPSYHLMRKA